MTRLRSVDRKKVLGFVAVMVVTVALVVMASMATRQGTDLGIDEPADDDRVVATLQTSVRQHSPELLANLHAARAHPNDIEAAKAAARGLIAEGRALGDSRLVGGAIGVLRSFMTNPDADALYLEATARQYQHDFDGALASLDRAIVLDPRHVNALLTRATLYIVLGRFDDASADCRRISGLPNPEVGFLCQSTALLLTAQAPDVYRRLEGIVAQPSLLDSRLRGWAIGLMGEIAALQGQDEAARLHLEEVLARDPEAIRERLLLADLLLRDEEADAVLTLLEDAPDVDGVLIRRVVAARMQGAPSIAEPAVAALADRIRLNLGLGLRAHAREEAMYFLQVEDDPEMALERAKVNWGLQREIEDAQLLIDAAVAAGAPAEAAPVLDWIAKHDISVPTLRVPDPVRDAAQ